MEEENSFLRYEIPKPDELPTPVSELLEKIHPPRTVTIDDKLKELHICSKPTIIFEVYELDSEFEKKLHETEGEIEGFSPALRKIHDQLFEELIRQEITICTERGLLFKRIREDMQQSLESLHEVCKSAFSYGVCKNLLSFRKLKLMQNEIPSLVERVEKAKERYSNLLVEQEQKREKAKQEAVIRAVERQFLENQVMKDNADAKKKYEALIDEEHRWLKEPTGT